MQPYSDQTIWNIEDSLKRFENAKWPQKNWKWKTTSKMFKMEDNIKKFENGRWLQKNCKWETTSKFLKRENENGKMKMEDNLKKFSYQHDLNLLLLPITKNSTKEVKL